MISCINLDSYGTKRAEYERSIRMFELIYKQQGLYFALAFLYDSQYDREDMLKMMEIIEPKGNKNVRWTEHWTFQRNVY